MKPARVADKSNHAASVFFAMMLLWVGIPSQKICAQDSSKGQATAGDAQRTVEQQAIRQQLDGFFQTVKAAEAALTDLETANGALETRLNEVRDDGRSLAADPTAHVVIQYYLENPVVDQATIVAKTRNANDLSQALVRALAASSNVSLPPIDTKAKILDDMTWARKSREAVTERKLAIDGMLARTPQEPPSAGALTIKDRIARQKADRDALWSGAEDRGAQSGRQQSAAEIAENARIAESKKGQQRAEQLLAEANARIAAMEREFEERLKVIEAEHQESLATLKRESDEKSAETKRKNEAAAVDIHAKNVAANEATGKQMDAAEHARKKALAQSTEVKELLKPFTTRGYYLIGGKASFDRQPVSLKALQAAGALDASPKGLDRLLDIGRERADKERPRFGYPDAWKKLSPSQKDELKKIQAHLIDLSEVLVEEGQLAP